MNNTELRNARDLKRMQIVDTWISKLQALNYQVIINNNNIGNIHNVTIYKCKGVKLNKAQQLIIGKKNLFEREVFLKKEYILPLHFTQLIDVLRKLYEKEVG